MVGILVVYHEVGTHLLLHLAGCLLLLGFAGVVVVEVGYTVGGDVALEDVALLVVLDLLGTYGA